MTFVFQRLCLVALFSLWAATLGSAEPRTTLAFIPGIGVNLAELGTGGEPVFVDAMKEASPWEAVGNLKRDELGNVAALAFGQVARTVIYPNGAYPSGEYTLLFDGAGTFAVAGASGTIVRRAPGHLWIRVAERPGYGIHIALIATDPRDYARNIRLVLPGFGIGDAASPFRPQFVAELRGLSALRFAGWEHPEPAGNRSWEARTKLLAFTQAGPRGVSPEYAIALANAARVNPWFTIPADATNDYVAGIARLVARTLDPRLQPAFEYGGEIWSPGTAGNAYAALAGRGLKPRAAEAALAWYSLRSVQIFSIVDGAFAGVAPRPAHVLSGPRPDGPRASLVDAQILRYANAAQHADAFAVSAAVRAIPAEGNVSIAAAFASAGALADAAHLPLIAYRGGVAGTLTPNLSAEWHAGGGSLLVADALGPQAPRAAYALAAAVAASQTRLSPSVTAFTPKTLSDLVAWYDASATADVTKTPAGGVTAWRDASGYGNTLSVPATHAPPVYDAAGINGKPSLFFDGKTVLAGRDLVFSKRLFNESTVFVVASETPTTISSDILFSGAYHERSPVWTLRPTFGTSSMFAFNTEIGGLEVRKVESGSTIWSAGGSVASARRDFRKNGSLIASGAGPSSVASGSYPLAVGSMYESGTAASYNYRGQIGEIVIYDRDLTTAESEEIEGYLACKWGLQKNLPPSHPYRNACPSGGTPPPSPAPTGIPLPTPPQISSVNGMLTLNVRAVADRTTGDPALSYDGSETPPTLNLNPGDTFIVNLTNALPIPPAGARYANDVNLHYHGLHVSPNAPADDSIDMVAPPGKSVRYEVPIPATHPPGLYWYHSHAHGEAERQNLAGMSGALVIAGIAKYAPAVTNMPQRILIVRDRQPPNTPLPPGDLTQIEAMRWSMAHASRDSDGELRGTTTAQTRNPYVDFNPFYRTFVRPTAADAHCQSTESATKVWTVNGVSQPSIGLKPGERQFWRLVNAGSDTYLDVQLDNATMQIVALDGVPLIKGTNTPGSMTVTHYVVPPASRIEFMVTGPGKPSYLRTNCFDAGPTGLAMPAAILASIDRATSGPAARPNAERISSKVRPFHFHTASFITSQPVSVKQTVFFSEQMQINGQSYDPSAPPMFYAQLGTTQDWTIVNTSTQVHTFHMHQVHFVLEAIDGVTQGREFVMDNVNVPPATASGPGTVRLRLDFTDPLIVGTFLVHCHILSHEDMGMMAKIRVGTAPPLSVSATTVAFASPTATAATITVSGGKAPYSPSGCKNVANASVSGSRVTIVPAGAGSCLLTLEDATGLIATVSVTVNAVASPVSLTPAALSFASPNAPAQSVRIAGGTLPYTASACAGAGATIDGATLTIAPKATGTCILVVSDAKNETAALSITINAQASGSPTDTLTFHNDALRTGWNQHETSLTVANVASSDFARIGTLGPAAGGPAFGKVWAQPLYVTNEATANGTHDLVIVATATNQVYAYDDKTLAVVWHRSFSGTGVVPQSWTDTGCYSPGPDVGITGTPVIDRALDRLYAVVATKENGTFHLRIHAISLRSGLEATTAAGAHVGPTDITGTQAISTGGIASVDPLWNLQRPALLESAGNIYVALGSKCDFRNDVIHGWMLSYSASTLAMTGNMFDTSSANDGTGYLGAIWMSGYGPAADPQGNVYFATGNGPYDGVNAFGMSVVKVAGTLSRARGSVSSFTPYAEAVDSEADADLGSGGVLLMPDQKGPHTHMIVAGGKCGAGAARGGTVGCQKYVLDRDDLGGRQANEAGALWHADTAGWMWGGPAYFADAAGISHIVYGGGGGGTGGESREPLSTYDVVPSPVSLTIQSSQSDVGCLVCNKGNPGGALPVVSSNGTQAGSAIVWAIQTPHASGGAMSLYAFDALAMSETLFHSVAGSWNVPPGASQIPGAFVSPLVADGKVYVPVDGSVGVFGLKTKSSAIGRGVRALPAATGTSSARRSFPGSIVYGTIVARTGDVLTVALRDARRLRVDASAAIAAGTFSAPLFVGKIVAVRGAYSADGTLHARTISKLGAADRNAPPDR